MTARTDTPFVVVTGKSTGPETDLIRLTATREGFPVIVADPFEDPRWSQLEPADHYAPGAGNHFDDRALGFTATIIAERLTAMDLVRPKGP